MKILHNTKCCRSHDFQTFRGRRRLSAWATALALVLAWPHINVAAADEASPTPVADAPAAEPAGGKLATEILVKFRPDVSSGEIERINNALGTRVLGHIEGIGVYRISVPSEHTLQELLESYNRDPRVEYAEPNYVGRGGDFLPDDTFFSDQWYLNNKGQTGGRVDADIDAIEGWRFSRGTSEVVVAVLDTGIDRDHPEFQDRLLQGFDFVDEDDDPDADHPHGILVAAVLAANSDNDFAGAGIDHHATILPVKVLDGNNAGTTADLVQGLIYAAQQDADVINMSLIGYPLTATLNAALAFARDAGSILIACAGNGGIGDADVSGPGASPLTISVGATDHNDARAGFSGTGAALDLVAPGLDLPTTAVDGEADDVILFGGCSAATPVVAGVASALLSIDPSLTHQEVRHILVQTAEDQVGPAAEDTSGRDDFFGFGRVNLNNALASLAQQVAIDIRPGRCPNQVRTDMRHLAVAVAGTGDLDVRAIDLRSLRLAGVRPDRARIRFRDATTPSEPVGRENERDCTHEQADGLEDLQLRFSNRKVLRALRPLFDRDVVPVPLTGKLTDGTPILGEDVIVVRSSRKRPGDGPQVLSHLEDDAGGFADPEDQP